MKHGALTSMGALQLLHGSHIGQRLIPSRAKTTSPANKGYSSGMRS